LPPPQRFPVGIDATGEEQKLPDRPRRQRVDRFRRSHQPQEGPHHPDRPHGLGAWSPLGNWPAAHELLGQPRDAVLAQSGKDAENRLRDERLQEAAHDAPLVSRPPFVADAVEGPVDLPTEKDRGAGAGTASGTSGTSRMRHVPAALMPVDTPALCCVCKALALHATWLPTFNLLSTFQPLSNPTFHVARFLSDSLYASNTRYNDLHLFGGSYGHADHPDMAWGHPAPR